MTRITYTMVDGSTIAVTLIGNDDELVAKYKNMDLNRMFIITDQNGKFSEALNPRHVVSISARRTP